MTRFTTRIAAATTALGAQLNQLARATEDAAARANMQPWPIHNYSTGSRNYSAAGESVINFTLEKP